jgi:hypothetical protein
MKIKVIANKPNSGQMDYWGSVEKLIGKTFIGKLDTSDDTVSIHSPHHGGQIVLNPGEFERVSEIETKPTRERK